MVDADLPRSAATSFRVSRVRHSPCCCNIKGALLGDLETGTILYEYNIDEPLYIASTTKLMTYCLLMDKISKGEASIEDEITISEKAANTWGSKFGMTAGEKIKISTMIDALLVVSGNDVAAAIAEFVGGSEEKFIEMMNAKAKELGLNSAKYINSHGLPDENATPSENQLSVRDMFTLVRHILTTYPEILEVSSKTELSIPERNYRKASTNPFYKTDEYVEYNLDGVDGLKTGYTDAAGICLISTMPVSAKTSTSNDYRVISIIMGADTHPGRKEKSKTLLESGRDDYIYETLCSKDMSEDIYVWNANDTTVKTYIKEDYKKIIPNGAKIKTEIVYNEKIEAPLKTGDKVGEMNIYVNDELVNTVDVEVREEIGKTNIFILIWRFILGLFGVK